MLHFVGGPLAPDGQRHSYRLVLTADQHVLLVSVDMQPTQPSSTKAASVRTITMSGSDGTTRVLYQTNEHEEDDDEEHIEPDPADLPTSEALFHHGAS